MKIARPLIFIIIALVAALLLQRSCNTCPKCDERPSADTTTSVVVRPADTVIKEVIRERPLPEPVVKYVPVPAKVDTAAILKEYFAKVYYEDSIRREGDFFLKIKDTIQGNRISSRELLFQNLRPVIEKTRTITEKTKPRNKLYVGGMIGYGHDSLVAGPSLLFITKKDMAIGYTYEMLHGTHMLSSWWKINLKK